MINQKEFIALTEALEFSAIDFGEDRAKGIESNAQSLLAEYRRRVHSVIEKLEAENHRLNLKITKAEATLMGWALAEQDERVLKMMSLVADELMNEEGE